MVLALSFDVRGLSQVRRKLQNMPGNIEEGAYIGTARVVLRGQSIVRGKASGRPGPRVITGAYRRSINGQVQRTPGGARGVIGTNAPQAARLEYGFSGADRLGRVYRQPPYPHFQPALPEIEKFAVEQIGLEIGKAID